MVKSFVCLYLGRFMYRKFVNLCITVFILVKVLGCSGISTLADKGIKKSLYSKGFLALIETAKSNYQNGSFDKALSEQIWCNYYT